MTRDIVDAVCRTLPGAGVSDPWGGGHDAWKVGGKMFACVDAVMSGVSVKTDSVETAQMLIDTGVGLKAPYLHRSWVNLPAGTSEDELRYRLTVSYRLVRAGLPKKVQALLAPFPEPSAEVFSRSARQGRAHRKLAGASVSRAEERGPFSRAPGPAGRRRLRRPQAPPARRS
jgi:predicted DNA-binding protein (MmcQ/YjbR family)